MRDTGNSHLVAGRVWVERFKKLLDEGLEELPEELVAEALMEIQLGVAEDPQCAEELFVELLLMWDLPPDQAREIFQAP